MVSHPVTDPDHARRRGRRLQPVSANLPLRPDLEGEAPYGAPEIDVPVRLNVNENPYPPSTAVIESIATAVARAAQGLNRHPERDLPPAAGGARGLPRGRVRRAPDP